MIRPFLVPAILISTLGPLAVQAAPVAAPAKSVPAQVKPAAAAPVVPVAPRPVPKPVDPALKALLDAGRPEPSLQRFYAQRAWAPAWSRSDQDVLIAVLRDADRHALIPRDFIPALDASLSEQERDVRLSRAALAYASAIAMGRVNPESVEPIFTLHRNVVDIPGGLNAALNGARLADWLKALAPQDKGYEGLSGAYLRYRTIAINGGWPKFKSGATIRPGDSDPRVPALAARLLAEGDLATPVEGTIYSDDLVKAMQAFQVRHGILDDGVIGADTQDELEATAEDRARQIATNLERRRWLARTVADERIDVNTAASILVYWKNGEPSGRRVINGKSNKATPSIEASFSTIMANPPWNVPPDIAAAEILPKGPGYLAAEDMYMTPDGRVVQRAGPKSALGLVKFEVQDPYAIYLHDTPSRRLFARYQRHMSHGCVRVEDAVGFARMLLASNPTALAEFDAAQGTTSSKRVSMGREIPVRMLYWTAFMTGKDKVAFRKDVYGFDSKLGEALGVGALSFQAKDRTKQEDVGP